MSSMTFSGRSVLVSTIVAVVAMAGPAHGQQAATAPTPPPPPPPPVAAGEDDAEVIIITGSRIARPEIAFANPVETLSAVDIVQSGKTNLTELLVESPALVGSITSEQNSGSNTLGGGVGVNLLDLRNLGIARTLVLVNGRRHVNAFPGENSVDRPGRR